MMLARKYDGCVARMRPDSYKRIPFDSNRAPVGYYIRCPHCEMILVVIADESEASDEDEKLSIAKPIECSKCGRKMVVRDGEFFDA